jgi:hypothetical protein
VLNVHCVRALGKGTAIVTDNTLVVIEDDFGNPIVVVVQVQPRVYTVIKADEPDFNKVLGGLGIDKIVVNDQIDFNIPLPGNDVKLLRGPKGFGA